MASESSRTDSDRKGTDDRRCGAFCERLNHFNEARRILIANRFLKLHYFSMAQPVEELIPTRTTLIQRLKDWQDQSSWKDFFDTYWKLIYGVARKGGLTETEAQDVVQETMICVARQMPTFKYDRSIGSFKAWLLNTTRWRIIDQLRKRGPGTSRSGSDDEVAQRTPTTEELVDPI